MKLRPSMAEKTACAFLQWNLRSCVVFADISSDKAIMNVLIRNMVIIWLIGDAVLFFISLLLANGWQSLLKNHETSRSSSSQTLPTNWKLLWLSLWQMLNDKSYSEVDRKNLIKYPLNVKTYERTDRKPYWVCKNIQFQSGCYPVGILTAVINSYIGRGTGNFYKSVLHIYLQKTKKGHWIFSVLA